MALNEEQAIAVQALVDHCLSGTQPFFVFKGPAGSGKTFCMTQLVDKVRRKIVFTAPTNKAVKVLREVLTTKDYKPECCTIYSLLGLSMQPNGEIKELVAPEDDIDLSDVAVVVVDEASMLNKAMLKVHIAKAAREHPTLRWIFMGDKWQLPPVGEAWSEVWEQGWPEAELTTIVRQDNQILQLTAQVRGLIQTPMKALALRSDHDGEEGVWCWTGGDLAQGVREDANAFLDGKAKFIAWRNITVDKFNSIIRQELFAEAAKYFYQPGDRVTMLGPVKDLLMPREDGSYRIAATTDEEGVVERADLADHPLFPEFKCWRILWRSDFNTSATLWTMHPSMQWKFGARGARMAEEARENRQLWKKFWEFKDAFHLVRHAYAITAHRAQGSTYERAYVNWRDIMLNQDRSEAYRCLYVAASRPKKELYLG